jgi:hypothetical protein
MYIKILNLRPSCSILFPRKGTYGHRDMVEALILALQTGTWGVRS